MMRPLTLTILAALFAVNPSSTASAQDVVDAVVEVANEASAEVAAPAGAPAKLPTDAQLAGWLDQAYAQMLLIPTDEEAYTTADTAIALIKLEARMGRADKTQALFGQLQIVTAKIAMTDGDVWSSCYLPAGQYLAGKRDDAQRAAKNLAFNPTIELDAWQMLAEAAAAIGQDEDYNTYTQKTLALFPRVVADGIKRASEGGYAYDGTFSAWFAAHTMRQQGDLANLGRLAAAGLVEPMELSGVLAVLSQMQCRAGDADAARATLGRAVDSMRTANAAKLADPENIWTDATTNLPELAAAAWLLDGKEAGLALGETLGQPYQEQQTDWKSAAALHAAAGFRTMGQDEHAAEALGVALASLNREPEGAWFDVNAAAHELVRQGRVNEAIAMAEADGPPNFRALALIGLVEGVLETKANPE